MAGVPGSFRFGDFELDAVAYDLRRSGRSVRIERQPMDLLLLLVERRGQLVLREEIIDRLWGKDVFVDVETGVHTAVRKIRRALGDAPDAPTFVETVSGKGYRFIAAVEMVAAAPEPSQPEPAASLEPSLPIPESAPPPATIEWRLPLAFKIGAVAAFATIAVGAALFWTRGVPGQRSGDGLVMLAVLPFTNLTADPGREYVAEGLAEDTSSSLGQIDPAQVRVIARSSTARYKNSNKSAAEIGRELSVDFIVESSLRAENNRLRVTSTLVRVRDQVQLWSQSYDREPTSLLGLQRELSVAIAEQIRLRVSPDRIEALAQRQTTSADAYDSYLRGRNFANQRTPATNQRALEYFTRATEVDPKYALAWSAIAKVLAGSVINGDASPSEVLPRARAAASRAVATGPAIGETQSALAYLNWCCEWDWPAAEAGFRLSLTLDSSAAETNLLLGHALSQLGRHAEASASTRRARELDALSPLIPALSSQVAFQARNYRGALDFARQANVVDPEFWIGHVMRGQALEQLGDYDAALEALTTAARFSGGNSKALSLRAYILARTGRAEEARAMRHTLETLSTSKYVPPYAMALISVGLGERARAFDWLERAYAARDMHLIYLPVDPKWDPYRGDPRFEALLVRCGFRLATSPVLIDSSAPGVRPTPD